MNGFRQPLNAYWVQHSSGSLMPHPHPRQYVTLVTLAPTLDDATAALAPAGVTVRAGPLNLDILSDAAFCQQHSCEFQVIPDGVLWMTADMADEGNYFPSAFRGWCARGRHDLHYPEVDFSPERVVASLISYRRDARS